MTLEIVDHVWDSVSGYVELTEIEKKILNSDPLQRLRRINPTPGSSYVYPELTGNRFSHSLGVKYLARRIVQRVKPDLNDYDVQNVRLAGLLHDIGHGPFSHTFDQYLKNRKIKANHEIIGYQILMNHRELKKIVRKESQRREIAYIAWGRKILAEAGVNDEDIGDLETKEDMKLFSDIVHGPPFCADILDFLIRDSRHAGVIYGNVDLERLIAYMDVFGNRLCVEDKAFHAYENTILARYFMYKTVYFHRSSRATEHLLLEALSTIDASLGRDGFSKTVQSVLEGKPKSIYRYMEFDDFFAFTKIRELLRKRDSRESRLAEQILLRQIPKQLYSRSEIEFDEKREGLGIDRTALIKLWTSKIVAEANARNMEISKEDIIVDIPSLTTIPLHAEPGGSEKLLFYRKGKSKRIYKPKTSVVERLSPKEYEIQIYLRDPKKVSKRNRKTLEGIVNDVWAIEETSELSTQA